MNPEKKRKLLVKTLSNFNHAVDPKELSKGIDEEMEHTSSKQSSTDVVKGNKNKVAKIAMAHLKEDPKYYSHLAEMTKKYGKK